METVCDCVVEDLLKNPDYNVGFAQLLFSVSINVMCVQSCVG